MKVTQSQIEMLRAARDNNGEVRAGTLNGQGSMSTRNALVKRGLLAYAKRDANNYKVIITDAGVAVLEQA